MRTAGAVGRRGGVRLRLRVGVKQDVKIGLEVAQDGLRSGGWSRRRPPYAPHQLKTSGAISPGGGRLRDNPADCAVYIIAVFTRSTAHVQPRSMGHHTTSRWSQAGGRSISIGMCRRSTRIRHPYFRTKNETWADVPRTGSQEHRRQQSPPPNPPRHHRSFQVYRYRYDRPPGRVNGPTPVYVMNGARRAVQTARSSLQTRSVTARKTLPLRAWNPGASLMAAPRAVPDPQPARRDPIGRRDGVRGRLQHPVVTVRLLNTRLPASELKLSKPN
jgi:hypothetical protein